MTRGQLVSSSERAVFNDYGRYIHVTTYAPCEDEEDELVALECVVGKNWVITAHDRPVAVLQEFADRASGSGDTGVLDGPAFLATLLEWVLGAYSEAFERLEERLEEFDVQAMRGKARSRTSIDSSPMRRRVGVLRRALAAHRSALTALTHPELEALGDDASGERFQSLLSRFEATVQEARDARESVVGSFDVLIARTGHRTNAIMKVLTVASVIAAARHAARRRDGHELQGRPLRGDMGLLRRRRRDRGSRSAHGRSRQAPRLAQPRRPPPDRSGVVTRPLWAPWRLEYVGSADEQEGCIFCIAYEGNDEEGLVVHRGRRAFVLLNKSPYASGHLLIAPTRHVGDFAELDDDETLEIHRLGSQGMGALAEVYGPQGYNLGWNLGRIAGAGITDHVHLHLVPRWAGDTDFMPVLADVKVLPEHLTETRRKLADAWPS